MRVLVLLTLVQVALARMPLQATRAIIIDDAKNSKELKEILLTYVDLGFNLIILSYGRNQRPGYGALPSWIEMENHEKLQIKRYMTSKDAFLL